MQYATGEVPKVGDVVCRELDHASRPMTTNDGKPLPYEGRNTGTVTNAEISSTCVRLSNPLEASDIPIYLACLLRKIR